MQVRDMYLTGRNVLLKSNGKGRLEDTISHAEDVHLRGLRHITCLFSLKLPTLIG